MGEVLYDIQTKGFGLDQILLHVTDKETRAKLILDFLNVVQHKKIKLPNIDPAWCWFNVSQAITSDHLIGRLAVVDFFTYCCINCMHILPDLEELESRFPKVLVVGFHSAKFDNEKTSDNIKNAIHRYGIHHPVVNDSEAVWWHSLGISCWPTQMIVDPKGHPIRLYIGEGHREEVLEFIQVASQFYQHELESPKLPLPAPSALGQSAKLLNYPGKVVQDGNKVFVSDTANQRILIIDRTNGAVLHSVGQHRIKGFKDGNFSDCCFSSPQGMTLIGDSRVIVADTDNHALRMIDLNDLKVTTLVGTGKQGQDLEGGKCGTEQPISSPWDVCLGDSPNAVGSRDTLFIAMAGTHQIWAYALSDASWWKGVKNKKGTCFRVAGTGKEENRNNSYPAKSSFAQPSGITYSEKTHTLYVADSESSSIRSLDLKNGSVKNVCGGSRDPTDLFAFGDSDGLSVEAKLQHPLGVAVDVSGELLYVSDSYNHKIKVVTKLQEKKAECNTIDCITGLKEPGGIFFDSEKRELLIANTNNHTIEIFSQEAAITSTLEFHSDIVDASLMKKTYNFKLDKSFKGCQNEVTKLEIDLPIDSIENLNEDAQSSWKIIEKDGEVQVEGNESGSIDVVPKLTFGVRGQGEMRIEVKLFLCNKENGTCSIKTGLVHLVVE